MRLLTHNYLQSNVKGTTKGYPLIIKAASVIFEESPFEGQLVGRLLPKLDYAALRKACEELAEPCRQQGIELPKLPDELPRSEQLDDALAADLYKVLFDIHIEEGFLVCPDTGREFPIKDGIPNMILHEDEV